MLWLVMLVGSPERLSVMSSEPVGQLLGADDRCGSFAGIH